MESLAKSIGMRVYGGLLAIILTALVSSGANAQSELFDRGWSLKPEASTLSFQSVKNMSVVETSGFATFSGQIGEDGAASVEVMLESVDTKIDLRNVRMRFLLFETFQFPTATITTQLDPAVLADLADVRRKTIRLPVTLDLHGVSQTFEADVTISVLDLDTVSVASASPISVATANYNLDGGIAKLEEAAGVTILPSASVTFDFLFVRNTAGDAPVTIASAAPAPSAALEDAGNFAPDACKGRFEILSRAQSIFFVTGSSRLDAKSTPFLNSLVDIISRCPGMVIEVSGHTDSDGSLSANQRLSERRANAVTAFLVEQDIPADRIKSVGYGETRPAVPNDSSAGKSRNRRIEFSVVE